jgi:hypothetical protein
LIVAALEFFPVIGNVTDQIALRILEDALADMCAYTPIERGKFVKIVAVEPPRVEEASIHGRSHFDVALDANTKAKKARILSDGEQRALSIACFLAEVGRTLGNHGIIVDDPVSSLDHLRLRTVAQRLVQEAANGRQVIIFTHNLVFFQEVRNAASRRAAQVPVTTHLIAKKEDGSFGLIYEGDVPWEAQRVRDRVPTLRHRIAAIPDGLDEQSPRYRQYPPTFQGNRTPPPRTSCRRWTRIWNSSMATLAQRAAHPASEADRAAKQRQLDSTGIQDCPRDETPLSGPSVRV